MKKTACKTKLPTKEERHKALQESRKRFNSTIRMEVSVSPAHLEVLEKLYLDPLRVAAQKEKEAGCELRPAGKALQSILALPALERQRLILEQTLWLRASLHLTECAMKLIFKKSQGYAQDRVKPKASPKLARTRKTT